MANDSDAEWGQAVAREITAYEQTTGTNVTQLVYGNDAFPTYHLTPPLRYAYYGINMRAVPVEWATPYIIEYYGGMDFESVMPIEDETKDELFGAGRDDAEFDESQVVCDGNVAYVLVY